MYKVPKGMIKIKLSRINNKIYYNETKYRTYKHIKINVGTKKLSSFFSYWRAICYEIMWKKSSTLEYFLIKIV